VTTTFDLDLFFVCLLLTLLIGSLWSKICLFFFNGAVLGVFLFFFVWDVRFWKSQSTTIGDVKFPAEVIFETTATTIGMKNLPTVIKELIE
jgi:hypothetical protein